MKMSDERKVFVGNLYYTVQVDQLRKEFNKFGKIQSVYLSPGYPITFAFITYKSKEDAKKAVNQMNGTVLQNRKLRVNLSSDHDKEFLANISAESCSEDETNLDKENGKLLNKDNNKRNQNNLILVKSNVNYKPLERNGSLKNEKSSLKDQLNEQFSKSNEDVSSTSAPKVETKKSSNRYFCQSVNPELSSYIKPKEKKQKSGKFNLVNFKKQFNKKSKQFQINQINPSETVSNPEKDQPFSTYQFKKPDNDLFKIYRRSNVNQQFNKLKSSFIKKTNFTTHFEKSTNLINSSPTKKSANLVNPFTLKKSTNLYNPFSKKSFSAIQATNSNRPKDDSSTDKNPFKFDEKAFGFKENTFFKNKNQLKCDDSNESTVIVLDNTLPRTYENTKLFEDQDIDERLNKSIEIITLD